MKVLVIYGTISPAKVTRKVAETVVAGMKESGTSADSYFVEDASKINVQDYDRLIVGAPTMAWKPSTRMKTFLAGHDGDDFAG